MRVCDYELIKNINNLFEKPIIIMCMGKLGSSTFDLLQDIGVTIEYIYDRNLDKEMFCDVPIISIDEMSIVTKERDYLIIVSTEQFQDEILYMLKEMKIKGMICTWYGVRCAVELNINNPLFNRSFVEQYMYHKFLRKKLLTYNPLFRIYTKLHEQKFDCLVYQPGKVGSTSLYNSLNKYGVESIHMHWWMESGLNEWEHTPEMVNLFKEVAVELKKMLIRPSRKLKIITAVRDPIGQALSFFMQQFTPYCIKIEADNNIVEQANLFVQQKIQANTQYEWFNKELKRLTGIDIFEYPFDKENGYCWIKKDNIEILVLKMENLNKNEEVIREFVNNKNFKIENTNEGAKKHYKYIYQTIKSDFKISSNVVKQAYDRNLFFKHLYTEKEKQEFLEKWKNNIITEEK